MLDSGISEVILPPVEKCYMISNTLKIHGGQTLKLLQRAINLRSFIINAQRRATASLGVIYSILLFVFKPSKLSLKTAISISSMLQSLCSDVLLNFSLSHKNTDFFDDSIINIRT